jgi:pre-mRNA branch site protein p14
MANNKNVRLGPEVNRILYVKNLPFQITGEELYDLFGYELDVIVIACLLLF